MYKAIVGLTNDKTGKRYEAGATVQDGDFPKSVIKAWLERGHLIEVNNGSDGNTRKK